MTTKNHLKVADASRERIFLVWKNPCKSRKLSEPSLSPRRLSVSETRCGFRPRFSRSEHRLPLLLFSYEKWSEHRTTFTYGSYEPKLRDASRKILKGDPRKYQLFRPFQDRSNGEAKFSIYYGTKFPARRWIRVRPSVSPFFFFFIYFFFFYSFVRAFEYDRFPIDLVAVRSILNEEEG